MTTLHSLFLSSAPLLSARFSSLTSEQRASLGSSLPAQKLGLKANGSGPSSLQREWESWMSKRTSDARTDFQRLLEENSFVDFWGKAGKLDDANEGDSKLVVPGQEDLEMSEIVGGGVDTTANDDGPDLKVDLKSLAKNITEKEVEKVLKVSGISTAISKFNTLTICRMINVIEPLTTFQRSDSGGLRCAPIVSSLSRHLIDSSSGLSILSLGSRKIGSYSIIISYRYIAVDKIYEFEIAKRRYIVAELARIHRSGYDTKVVLFYGRNAELRKNKCKLMFKPAKEKGYVQFQLRPRGSQPPSISFSYSFQSPSNRRLSRLDARIFKRGLQDPLKTKPRKVA